MIFSLPINFLIFLECIQLQNYQNMTHYPHSHAKLPNEFLLIYTHQDLLYMPPSCTCTVHVGTTDKISQRMRKHQKICADLVVPSSAQIAPLLVPNVPNKIPRNPPFCSFA